MKFKLPVRFADVPNVPQKFATLDINPEKTGFLLVDCDGDCGEACNGVIDANIAPALTAVRRTNIQPIYLYNLPTLVGEHSMENEIFRKRHGAMQSTQSFHPSGPSWTKSIAPLGSDQIIAKQGQSGFVGTDLDRYCRISGIDTLICVGFSFKSCLFYTMVYAFNLNYRVIFLRDGTDPLGTNEFSDTLDASLPDKGWVRHVLTRLIEDHLGYSATCTGLVKAINGC